ncbi:MAG: hypothetical protein ACTHMG_00545 [Sphingomonas sp.]
MRNALRSVVLASLALGCSGMARAQNLSTSVRSTTCQLQIDMASTSWIIRGYDPFGANQPAGTYDLLFINQGNQECRFYPVFMTDQAAFGLRADNGAPVPYSLVDETDGYDATPLAGRTVRRVNNPPVVIPARGQQQVRYILAIDPDRLTSDGLFSQTLLMEAEEANGAIITQRQLTVGIDVLPSAVMTLAGAFTRVKGRADVDLGDLTEGLAKVPLQLNVQSTRAFRLGVESQNNGKLQLAGTQWSIPYQMLIDGRVAAANSARGYVSDNRPGRRTATLPISFVIGDTKDKRAGVYSDVVTISVAVD